MHSLVAGLYHKGYLEYSDGGKSHDPAMTRPTGFCRASPFLIGSSGMDHSNGPWIDWDQRSPPHQPPVSMSQTEKGPYDPGLSEAIEKTVGIQPWRRVFHAVNGTLVVLALTVFGMEVPTALVIMGVLLAFAMVLDAVRLLYSKWNILFFRTFSFLASPREARKIASSTWYALSVFLVLLLFSRTHAMAGILVLAWADPAASVVGQRWGKIPFLAGSVRGTGTFFLVASFALILFVPWKVALVTGAATAIVEAAPINLDDNLIVPLTVAGILLLLGG